MPGDIHETQSQHPESPSPTSPAEHDAPPVVDDDDFLRSRMTELMQLVGFGEEDVINYIHILNLNLEELRSCRSALEHTLIPILDKIEGWDDEVVIHLLGNQKEICFLPFLLIRKDIFVYGTVDNEQIPLTDQELSFYLILLASFWTQLGKESWIMDVLRKSHEMALILSNVKTFEIIQQLLAIFISELRTRIISLTEYSESDSALLLLNKSDIISIQLSDENVLVKDRLSSLINRFITNISERGFFHIGLKYTFTAPEIETLTQALQADDPTLEITVDYHVSAHPDEHKPGFINFFVRKRVA